MKRAATLGAISFAVMLLAASVPVVAQHGHAGGAGGGMGSGMGGGMGAGNSNMPGNHDMGQPNNSGHPEGNGSTNTPGPQSPTTMLADNSKLNSALTSSLTKKGVLPTGTNLADDCKGFKNLGDCVSALHVSHNLGDVNFFCLRQAMTTEPAPSGSTCSTSGKMSLGKAIQTLAPDANSKSEAKQGTQQAHNEIRNASS